MSDSSRSPSRSPSPSLSPDPSRRADAGADDARAQTRHNSDSEDDEGARRRRLARRSSRGSRRRRKGSDSSPSPSLTPSPSRSRSSSPRRRRRRATSGSDSDRGRSLTPPPNHRRTRSSSRSPSPAPPARSRSPSPSAAAAAARRRRQSRASESPPAAAPAPSRSRPSAVPAKAAVRARVLGPNSVPRSLLQHSSLSLHPPLFRLRFSLRLSQNCADILAINRRADLQRLILDLLLSECAATGRTNDASAFPQSRIELLLLRRVEERSRVQPAQGYTLFSNAPGAPAADSIVSMAPSAGPPSGTVAVWYATVVILFDSESEAEFVAARMHGLTTNAQGYAVSVDCRLLSSSASAHELRRRWEMHYFPTLLDNAARVAGSFGPSSFQMTLAFNAIPAGQRPDTIVLKYIPLSWVDGSLLTKRGRQRARAALSATVAPASAARKAIVVPRLRYCGGMEEDEGASLSASDVDSEEEDAEKSGPSWRRLLLLIKRQLELLLQPAAKLAKLSTQHVNVRRWEYRPLQDENARQAAHRRRVAASMEQNAPGSVPAGMPSDISDDMIRFPLLNPYATQNDAVIDTGASAGAPIAGEEESKSDSVAAPAALAPMVPLCDVYIMLDDYPTMLACFDYLHNKRMQNRLDTEQEEEEEEEEEEKEEGEAEEGETKATASVNTGRIIDFGIDVDRDGYLRFDNIEQRRQMQQEEIERAQAAAQLAAHTARKKKEEAMRLEREAALRRQEEETERMEMLARAKREAEQREAERLRLAAEARAREEARAHREALDAIDRARRLEEKQRQAQRRAEQRAEEAAARGQVDSLQARMDAEEAALLAEEIRAEEERAVRRLQLEALRRRRGEEQDALSLSPTARPPPPPPLPPQVIDLDNPAHWESSSRGLTPAAVGVLELWFQQHIERPFPTDSVLMQLSHNTGLSVTQVREWFAQARKTDWKMSSVATSTPSSAPIIIATARASSSNNNNASDQMPGLLSARDEAADSMARRVAAAQAAQSKFKMQLVGRRKVQTDEEAMMAGADGFVRVVDENGEIVQRAADSTPAFSPPPLPMPTHEAAFVSSTPQRSPDNNRGSQSDYRNSTPMTPSITSAAAAVAARPQLLDKVASAVAALEAKLKKADAATSSPPIMPVPAPMDVGAEGAAAALPPPAPDADADADASKKRSRSRSGSRSRSPSKKHKKRHRSRSRSKKSSRRHRSRSRDRDFDMGAMPFFPFPPPFGFPPFGFPPFMAHMMPPHMAPPHMAPPPTTTQEPEATPAPDRERSSGRSSRSSRTSAAAGQPQPPSLPMSMPPMQAGHGHMPPHMAHHFAQMAMGGRMPPGYPPTDAMEPSSRSDKESDQYPSRDYAYPSGGGGGGPSMHPDRERELGLDSSPPVDGESSKRKSSSSRRKSKHKSRRESSSHQQQHETHTVDDSSRWRGGEGF